MPLSFEFGVVVLASDSVSRSKAGAAVCARRGLGAAQLQVRVRRVFIGSSEGVRAEDENPGIRADGRKTHTDSIVALRNHRRSDLVRNAAFSVVWAFGTVIAVSSWG